MFLQAELRREMAEKEKALREKEEADTAVDREKVCPKWTLVLYFPKQCLDLV
jgi:hypothetical protein